MTLSELGELQRHFIIAGGELTFTYYRIVPSEIFHPNYFKFYKKKLK
jgi:hypothetical protein